MLIAAPRGLPALARHAWMLRLFDPQEAFREVDPCRVSTALFARGLSSSPTEGTDGNDEPLGSISGKTGGETPTSGLTAKRRRSLNNGRGDGRKLGKAMGLKEFMHRQRVLELYRGILKRARTLQDSDVASETRRQFRISQDETDPLKVKMLLADAKNYLEAMQVSSREGEGAGVGGTGTWLEMTDPEDERGRVGTGFPWERS